MSRIDEEMALIRRYFPLAQFVTEGQWVLIPSYPLLHGGWNRTSSDVAFQIPRGHPGTPPYGFSVPAGILFNGARPNNYVEPAQNVPPFPGPWGTFSWSPDGEWRPTASLQSGPNLLNYARGFADRFREGA